MVFALCFDVISATTNAGGRRIIRAREMALRNTLNENLSDQQRLERLAKLCEELQSAVDTAGEQRRILEELKQTAQELLSDAESKPPARKKKR
jgi:hypothetical protein